MVGTAPPAEATQGPAVQNIFTMEDARKHLMGPCTAPRTAPSTFASALFAPVRSAPDRLAIVGSAPERLARERIDAVRWNEAGLSSPSRRRSLETRPQSRRARSSQ
jgi:hypothetical protein